MYRFPSLVAWIARWWASISIIHSVIMVKMGLEMPVCPQYQHECNLVIRSKPSSNLQMLIRVQLKKHYNFHMRIQTALCALGKLTILCLGPLTNLAMAVKFRPDLKNLVKEIFILGGNMEGNNY